MPDHDWLPNRQGERKAFFENFVAEAPAIGQKLNIDVSAAVSGASKWVGSYNTFLKAKATADGAAKGVEERTTLTVPVMRAVVRLFKATPGLTPEMRAALLIDGDDTDPTTLKAAQMPELHLAYEGGHVVVKFTKHGHEGIYLYSRRGDETEWTLLGLDTHSPYVDNRPNLVPGQPEDRHYRAYYADHDQRVGELSATVTIAVRG